MSQELHNIALAVIAAIPATIGAIAALVAAKQSRLAARHAEEINDSVNHRHERGGMRVYDLAVDGYKQGVRNRRMLEAIVQHLRDASISCPHLDEAAEAEDPSTESLILQKRSNPDEETE